MRYNIVFTLKKDKEVIKKFEIVELNSNDKRQILRYLSNKYPDYKVNIQKMNQSLNGLVNN
jgi:hypothetical protein